MCAKPSPSTATAGVLPASIPAPSTLSLDQPEPVRLEYMSSPETAS